MKWIKNLFNKKETTTKEVEQTIETLEPTSLICEYCKMSIFENQKIKTFNGKKFHLKPCWYKLLKDSKKEAFK